MGEISVPDSVSGAVPELYSSFAPLLQQNKSVTLPSLIWPNPAVGTALTRSSGTLPRLADAPLDDVLAVLRPLVDALAAPRG